MIASSELAAFSARYAARGAFVGALAVVGAATATGAALGTPLPALAAFAIWGLLALPVRWSCTAIVALLLALDRTTDAEGLWHSPFAIVGDVLSDNLDSVFPALRGLKLSGVELILFLLIGVTIRRRARTGGSSLARTASYVQTATPARDAMLMLLAGVVFAVANGMIRGGSPQVAIWHARPWLLTGLMFLAFQAAFRGPADHRTVGAVVVGAACVKAALAGWIRLRFVPSATVDIEYVTNHGDSVLFVVACVIVVARFLERWDRRSLLMAALFAPVLLGGIIANDRRLAWVELGLALIAIYLVSPWRTWKRVVTRALVGFAPVLLLYCAAGWTSSAAVFRPVHTIRSVLDSETDRSTWCRHVENWNLTMSMHDTPLRGRGFGHEWTEYFRGDDITSIFPMYKAEPHNMVLGLLVFAGLLGFLGIWSLLTITVFLAARAHRCASSPDDRAAALVLIAIVVALVVQTYGDLGPYSAQFRVFLALAATFAGKLAVATGAWPARPHRVASPRCGAASAAGGAR